jgi:hypothetical protein
MSAESLAAVLPVLIDGALMCSAPAASRPTVQFGVRVPRERAGAPVIRRERRAYYWRTAAIGVCCTAVAILAQGHGSWWLPRIILLPELAAGFGCFWAARRKIAAVKNAEEWFAGLRQTVVTDTSWRAQPTHDSGQRRPLDQSRRAPRGTAHRRMVPLPHVTL